MTVETEVANLTTAVDNLTASVNVAKGTLDAKVSDAQTAEANAASHETGALAAKNAAETAAASAVSVVQQDLSALGFDVPHGAVAICPIDPYEHGFVTWPVHGKQSWRSEARATGKYLGVHGTTASAWAVTDAAAGDYYWDSTNQNVYELTGTAGASQVYRAGSANFTARWAVAFAYRVVLLDETGAPWMAFANGAESASPNSINALGGGTKTMSLAAIGSRIFVGCGGTAQSSALLVWDFNEDRFGNYSNNLAWAGWTSGNIASRNSVSPLDGSLPAIVDQYINAVAATVLPDAPIKSGVPVPTIAVATDSGVSVIKDDGSVVDLNYAGWAANDVIFLSDTEIAYQANSGEYWVYDIPDADQALQPKRELKTASVPSLGSSVTISKISPIAVAMSQRFARTWENPADPASGMVAYQADDYTTPPMFGDVKGAFLCEQGQAGVLVGANVASTSFDGTGNLDGFVLDTTGSGATNNNGVGYLDLTAGDVSNNVASYTLTGLVIGQLYGVSFSRVAGGNYSAIFRGGVGSKYTNAAGPDYFEFTATATSHGVDVRAGSSGGNARIDNFSVDAVHPDRSVNGKGLIINGSLNQDADGWVSGFSATDYLEQPYNADLDLTGDFYAFVAVNAIGNGYLFARGEQGVNQPIHLRLFNGALRAAAGGAVDADVDFPSGSEGLVGLVLRGTTLEVWQLGSLVGTGAGTPNSSGVEDIFRIGIKTGGEANALMVGSIRRVVIGAGAPSHAQIKVMSDWVGDRLEGAFKDMHFEPSTKVLHVLTDAYHYEVDADGAVLKATPNTETWLKVTASRDGVVRTS